MYKYIYIYIYINKCVYVYTYTCVTEDDQSCYIILMYLKSRKKKSQQAKILK